MSPLTGLEFILGLDSTKMARLRRWQAGREICLGLVATKMAHLRCWTAAAGSFNDLQFCKYALPAALSQTP
jgi:hypothetical protein